MKKIFLIKESTFKNAFPDQINDIIRLVLKVWGRSKYFYLFKNNIELLPLIANLVNYSAKMNDAWYEDKYILVDFLLERHSFCWISDNKNIAYFETPYGQITFHIHHMEIDFDEILPHTISNQDREWSKQELQWNDKAIELIDQAIEDSL